MKGCVKQPSSRMKYMSTRTWSTQATRHLESISAVAVELDADARESLLHQPDIASITANCIIHLPNDEDGPATNPATCGCRS